MKICQFLMKKQIDVQFQRWLDRYTTVRRHGNMQFPIKALHKAPLKRYAPYHIYRYAPYRSGGMGHTVLVVNSKVLKCFANGGCGGRWFIGGIDTKWLLL